MSDFDWHLWAKNFPFKADRYPAKPKDNRPVTAHLYRGGQGMSITFEELQQHILPLFRDEMHEKIREAYAFMPNDEGSEVADHVLAALCSTPAPTDEDYARDWYVRHFPADAPSWQEISDGMRDTYTRLALEERDRNHDDWESTHAYS